MTPQQHAQLLRELAYIAQENAEALSDDGFGDQAEDCFKAAALGRQAAEELDRGYTPADVVS